MFQVLNSAWALLLGMGLLMVGNGLQGTILGVRGQIEGFSTLEMSIIMSAYFVGFLGGSRLAPDMIRRVGHVRVEAGHVGESEGGLQPVFRFGGQGGELGLGEPQRGHARAQRRLRQLSLVEGAELRPEARVEKPKVAQAARHLPLGAPRVQRQRALAHHQHARHLQLDRAGGADAGGGDVRSEGLDFVIVFVSRCEGLRY